MAAVLLNKLREQLAQVTRDRPTVWGLISSGLTELDAILPQGGLRRGTLVEWLAAEPGSGATHCALLSAREAMAGDRPLVVIEHDDTFHPPGLGAEIDWPRVLLVRCPEIDAARWATDQALRTSGVGAVLGRFDEPQERWLRRWQLAAERSGAVGLVVRHLARQPEACFSDLRILVTPMDAAEGRRVRLEILRSRQGMRGAAIEVVLHDDAPSLSQTTFLSRRRAAGG